MPAMTNGRLERTGGDPTPTEAIMQLLQIPAYQDMMVEASNHLGAVYYNLDPKQPRKSMLYRALTEVNEISTAAMKRFKGWEVDEEAERSATGLEILLKHAKGRFGLVIGFQNNMKRDDYLDHSHPYTATIQVRSASPLPWEASDLVKQPERTYGLAIHFGLDAKTTAFSDILHPDTPTYDRLRPHQLIVGQLYEEGSQLGRMIKDSNACIRQINHLSGMPFPHLL